MLQQLERRLKAATRHLTWRPYSRVFGVLCACLIVGIIIWLPEHLIAYRHLPLTAKEQLDAEASIRAAILQLLGGSILVAGLYFTAQGFRLTREGHITDRYSKAIEHLGSDNLDVRTGGVYELERIARDSKSDRITIINVLTSFIREHTKQEHRIPSKDTIGADVQAALDVLGRRDEAEGSSRLDLYHCGLNDADLSGGDFRQTMFYYSRLFGTSFSGARLDGAGLSFCKARGAAFTRASARDAHFVNASYLNGWFLNTDLTNADFYGCDLSGSDFGQRYAEEGNPPFSPANLRNARFTNAILDRTNLRGVDLSTVRGLTVEQLAKAITDDNTIMPIQWGPVEDDFKKSRSAE